MNVLGISGSLRAGSYNTRLLQTALRRAEEAGASTMVAVIGDLPIFSGDLTATVPPAVSRLREHVKEADVIVIASPEYNYSIPGGLKNAIDWASKPNMFDGKVAAIMGASPGPFGTLRMQPHLRQVLAALNVLVLPQPQIMVRNASEAFDAEGGLRDAKLDEQVRTLIKDSLRLAQHLAAVT